MKDDQNPSFSSFILTKKGAPRVTEHRIRLGGGWGCCAAGLPKSAEQRVTLPIRWRPDGLGRLRLTRRFGRPPFEPEREVLILRLDQVAGIHCILLNGQPVAGVSPESSMYEIQLEHALDRNLLEIELEPPLAGVEAAEATAEWGIIALVIRPIEPPASSLARSP